MIALVPCVASTLFNVTTPTLTPPPGFAEITLPAIVTLGTVTDTPEPELVIPAVPAGLVPT
jgi:hypothetical protein